MGNVQVAKPAAVAGSPDLKVTKTATASVIPGGTVSYTINYQNLSNTFSATGAQITDLMPPDVSYNTGSCTGGAPCFGWRRPCRTISPIPRSRP